MNFTIDFVFHNVGIRVEEFFNNVLTHKIHRFSKGLLTSLSLIFDYIFQLQLNFNIGSNANTTEFISRGRSHLQASLDYRTNYCFINSQEKIANQTVICFSSIKTKGIQSKEDSFYDISTNTEKMNIPTITWALDITGEAQNQLTQLLYGTLDIKPDQIFPQESARISIKSVPHIKIAYQGYYSQMRISNWKIFKLTTLL